MIETDPVQWSALAPDLVLLGGAAVLLLVAVLLSGRTQRDVAVFVGVGCFIGAGATAIAIWDFGGGDWTVLSGQLRVDRFGNGIRVIVAGAGLLTLLIAYGWDVMETRGAEFVALLLLAAVGMDLLAVSNSFVALFVSLELFSITLYTLCALDLTSRFSLESSLKYLVLGSVGSAVLLYGAAFLYGATGTFRFDEIARALGDGGGDDRLALVGMAMVLAGLAFKVSAVPFHQWTPDVYEGAPTPVTGFMAAATKAVAFAALVRVLVQALPAYADQWQPAIATLAILSLVFGNVVALVQDNVKRMLAYSSIGHAGYLLTAVVAGTELGSGALLFYLAVYTAMTVGAFAAVAARERELGAPVTVEGLRGWGFSRPYLAGMMALCLLSLAGFPLTGGFIGKLLVWNAAVDAGYTYLAVVGVVATAISLGYYLRVGFALFDRRREGETVLTLRRAPGYPFALAAGALTVVVILWLGLYPTDAIDWARDAARPLALGD
jgi:NADH-quinone oxidoreductase subunit N